MDEELEGYVTLKDGSPKNALLYTPSDMEISGDEAFSKIIGMDGMENIYLEVHTNIDIDNLIEDIGGKVSEDIQNSIPENTDEAKELFERVE